MTTPSNDTEAGYGLYIARRTVRVERVELWDVPAHSEEDAARRLAAGAGQCYATLTEEIVEVTEDWHDIHYDWNEGMGR